jgi:hypothetical protein
MAFLSSVHSLTGSHDKLRPNTEGTRLMNQPLDGKGRGVMYSGLVDCLLKTVKAEGPLAIYKGFFAQWARVGPYGALPSLAA